MKAGRFAEWEFRALGDETRDIVVEIEENEQDKAKREGDTAQGNQLDQK